MREKFELACKIIGLIFFVGGIFVLFLGLVYFLFYNAFDRIPQSSLSILTKSQIADLQNMTNSVRNTTVLMLLFGGIIEIVIGYYLMKSNNFFVNLCYPLGNRNVPVSPPSDIQLNAKSEQSIPEEKEPSGDKYAPPGYFQK